MQAAGHRGGERVEKGAVPDPWNLLANTIEGANDVFDAVAFGPITLNHLPPFAQRLRHAVHVETEWDV